MRSLLAPLAVSLALFAAAPAAAADPPYLKLAQALGTPTLSYSRGPKDKSQLLLDFVPAGESYKHWTKMTTISILHVANADTESATRGVIARLRATLKASHAKVAAFEQSAAPPTTGYFNFTAGVQTQRGIVYSPAPGWVTVAQVGATGGGKIDPGDIAKLRSLIGK